MSKIGLNNWKKRQNCPQPKSVLLYKMTVNRQKEHAELFGVLLKKSEEEQPEEVNFS